MAETPKPDKDENDRGDKSAIDGNPSGNTRSADCIGIWKRYAADLGAGRPNWPMNRAQMRARYPNFGRFQEPKATPEAIEARRKAFGADDIEESRFKKRLNLERWRAATDDDGMGDTEPPKPSRNR